MLAEHACGGSGVVERWLQALAESRGRIGRSAGAHHWASIGDALPDARLGAGCRGRAPGVVAWCVAGHHRVRGARLTARVAVPHQHQRLPAADRPPSSADCSGSRQQYQGRGTNTSTFDDAGARPERRPDQ